MVLVLRVKHPTKVIVWGMISIHGPGRLHVCKGIVNAQKYIDILRGRMIPQLREWFPNPGDDYIFMQDGAPCHTAKSVKAYLSKEHVPLLPWPGNSPDLNPIENLWRSLKREIYCNGGQFNGKHDLWEAVNVTANNVSASTIANLTSDVDNCNEC